MREVFKFLKSQTTKIPRTVDRLIVSSFLQFNNLHVLQNLFIKGYIISEENGKEFEVLKSFNEILQSEIAEFDFEHLIELFEFVVSPQDKVITGAIYTPVNIRKFIIECAFKSKKDKIIDSRIADISCGCGSFLFNTARNMKEATKKTYTDIFEQNLFGLDIQEYSIVRTELLLTLLAISEGEDNIEFKFNLYVGDALNFKWTNFIKGFKGFDMVLGNPPYVCSRNISEESTKYLTNWEVCKTGHPDLYIPFFQIGIENLLPGGFLGFITMNTFFKSVNGRALRNYFQVNNYKIKIIDFGSYQIFQSKSTYTCICFIEKVKSDVIEYTKLNNSKLDNILSFNSLAYSTLDSLKGWNLQNVDNLKKIENVGVPFGELYKTRNGIATLKNHIYIFNPVKETKDYYYLQNGSLFEIEKGICRDIVNPNKLVQTQSIAKLKQKVIFPYHYEAGKAKLVTEQFLATHYPKTLKYLKAKKEILATRDKGNGNYEKWFAYGRNQSLEKLKHKLLFPHISPGIPSFTISSDENLLFYNGLAVITENKEESLFLQKLMSTDIFWYYIKNSSKPYGSGYYSLSRNYIKNFGVYAFNEADKKYIIQESDHNLLNEFVEGKYQVRIK